MRGNGLWTLCAVLSLTLCCPACSAASRSGENEARPGPIPPPGRWEASLSPDATIVVRLNGATVAQAKYLFWGRSWKYADCKIAVHSVDGRAASLTGEVPDLGLKIVGQVRNPTPEALEIDYRLEASRGLDDIVGGGLEWRCRPDSPAFGPGSSAPTLSADGTGWSWPVARGQAIEVRFSSPLASANFERGEKSTIRTLFVGKSLRPGTSRITMTVRLPAGGNVVPAVEERYGPADTRRWYRDALRPDISPIDLTFLNDAERPAGRRGFVRAEGDRLVFGDGTPARFWGGNLAAYALFTDKPSIARQARRIAQLGYNLMRIHHHDSMRWVKPTVIDQSRADSRHLDAAALDHVDWWIHCLKREGVYVWLDLHDGRQLKEGDEIGPGFDEVRRAGGEPKGFNYLNPRVQELMREFQGSYLRHVNPYTKLAYKDEPAIMGMLVTNENDMTQHGHFALPDKNNPFHNKIFMSAAREFAAATGLPYEPTWHTWEPGPSKVFLNDIEHRFNTTMRADLARIGVKVPVATTNAWGDGALSALPALADGDVIDVHSYGTAEALSVNPRYEANYLSWIAAARVAGKPLTITEWNVPYPAVDRFTSPLYIASVASLQGWDAPMIYNYSQEGSFTPGRPGEWSTFADPALTGMMPAAAVAYRQGHVSRARATYRLELGRDLILKNWTPVNSASLRTLTERGRVEIGLPKMKEWDWDRMSAPAAGVNVVTEPNRDFIPAGQGFVESDTGELRRDWEQGYQTIDTPRTQAVSGWVGGRPLRLKDVSFRLETKKAVVAVTSLDGRPIASSRRVLVTALARVVASPGGRMPFLSEPVTGSISVRSDAGAAAMRLVSLAADGRELPAPPPRRDGDAFQIDLPVTGGTHWFLLKAVQPSPGRP